VRDAPTILHADLDAFYASVEQLLNPSLRGKPIAVGGGVVLAASYEAKRFGVSGGMSGWKARQLCPQLQFVDGHFREYQRLGDHVMRILEDVTPLVERISIDEAFCDVAGALHLFGTPAVIAEGIRRRVREEVGLPISVGAARTKHLAKIASQVAKPDGLVIVEPATEEQFLRPLPVGLMWGVGPVTQQRLAESGIRTIGQLADSDRSWLQRLLGQAAGTKLGSLAHNDDERSVVTARRAGSVGAQSALGRRVADDALLTKVLGQLADRIGSRLRAKQRGGRTVTVRVRFAGMRAVTRSLTLSEPASATLLITDVAVALARTALRDHPEEPEISLLGISVSNLVGQPALQLCLPFDEPADHGSNASLRSAPGSAQGAARWAVDRQMDAVRERFGRRSVGYGSAAFPTHGSVPDEFREIAERDG
jgi:DNA polymerase IV